MFIRKIVGILTVGLVVPMLWIGAATAQEQGTPEEAKVMAEAAAALFQAEGADAAFAAFTSAPEFHDRDLYVFVMDDEGTMVAHGTSPALVGRSMVGLMDPTGYPFIEAIMAVEDTGWVDYQWQNPATGAVAPKRTYIINTGDHWIGVGAYVNE